MFNYLKRQFTTEGFSSWIFYYIVSLLTVSTYVQYGWESWYAFFMVWISFCDLDNFFECRFDYNNELSADYLTTMLGHRYSVVEMFEKFNVEYQTFPLGCSCIR